jgi:hypothetical protein
VSSPSSTSSDGLTERFDGLNSAKHRCPPRIRYSAGTTSYAKSHCAVIRSQDGQRKKFTRHRPTDTAEATEPFVDEGNASARLIQKNRGFGTWGASYIPFRESGTGAKPRLPLRALYSNSP